MKRSIIALALLTLVVTFALGQMKRNDSVEAQIVALEKSAFEAWKNKDREFFCRNLVLYTTFPFVQRLFRASGFEAEAALMEEGAGLASLTDRLLDSVCLLGPVSRCREQMTLFRAAGIDLPILVPPIGVEGARAVIQAFRR